MRVRSRCPRLCSVRPWSAEISGRKRSWERYGDQSRNRQEAPGADCRGASGTAAGGVRAPPAGGTGPHHPYRACRAYWRTGRPLPCPMFAIAGIGCPGPRALTRIGSDMTCDASANPTDAVFLPAPALSGLPDAPDRDARIAAFRGLWAAQRTDGIGPRSCRASERRHAPPDRPRWSAPSRPSRPMVRRGRPSEGGDIICRPCARARPVPTAVVLFDESAARRGILRHRPDTKCDVRRRRARRSGKGHSAPFGIGNAASRPPLPATLVTSITVIGWPLRCGVHFSSG